MNAFKQAVIVLSVLLLTIVGWAEQDKEIKLELDLVDGSRVIGVPTIKSVPVVTPYARIDIGLDRILSVNLGDDGETPSFELRNGDKLTAMLELRTIELETLFGRISVEVEQITRLCVMLGDRLPPGKGPLSFGGLNWTPWRTMFEVRGDKLVTLPRARPGFNYGHSGNGRDATLVSNVGNKNWKHYSIELEYGMTGVDPAFNPHNLPKSHRSGGIMFHVVDAKESWNEAGSSLYRLGLNAKGGWSLGCAYNSHCAQARGHGNSRNDGRRTLAKGEGLVLDPKNGNKIRIDVRSKRIQVWVDGKKIADVRDEKMDESIGGRKLDHGGIGVSWGWECMGWIRNFSARKL